MNRQTKHNMPFNKFLYIGFLGLGLYQALATKDFMQSAASFGIGLVFDPFNQQETWKDSIYLK
jgi:hypothetical protein